MSRIRVVFLGTPEFAAYSLERLLTDEHFEVVGVVSQPDRRSGRNMRLQPSPVKAVAVKNSIPVISPDNVNDARCLAQISEWRAEAAVVIAFGQIMSQAFLDLFPRRVVNVHASLLPRWRGAAPIQRALMEGDEETGVCLQIMVKKLDAGDILGTRQFKIPDEMNAKGLHDRLMALSADLLHVELMDYVRGNLTGVAQSENGITYAKKIEKSEGLIEWDQNVEQIQNKIRAFSMSPGAWTFRDGKKLKIHKTEIHDQQLALAPGMVYQILPESLLVTCGKGILKILEVQPESRDRLLMKTYLRGYPVSLGEMWG